MATNFDHVQFYSETEYASRALCQAKRAPRAAFPSSCLAAQTKRWAEGIRVPVKEFSSYPRVQNNSGKVIMVRGSLTVMIKIGKYERRG